MIGRGNKKGFTLIELLIAIAIIGILAAIVVPQFTQYKERTFNLNAKAGLHNLYLACKAYWADKTSSAVCSTEVISSSEYGYNKKTDIRIQFRNATENNFFATAQHSNSKTIYTIDNTGNIK